MIVDRCVQLNSAPAAAAPPPPPPPPPPAAAAAAAAATLQSKNRYNFENAVIITVNLTRFALWHQSMNYLSNLASLAKRIESAGAFAVAAKAC